MNPIEALKDQIDQRKLWSENIVLKRSEFLKVKGSKDTRLFYIVSGSLHLFFEDEYEQQTLRLGYQGNFIASLDSFISEKPSDLYIQAIKKSEIKVISKSSFQTLLNDSKEAMQLWMLITQQLIFQQLEREKDILTYSPAARYQRVLERSPQLFQEIPAKYIASYLRMSPETLSRLKN